MFKLNFSYKLVTQKAHATVTHVFVGADVSVLWSNVVQENKEPGENHRAWMGTVVLWFEKRNVTKCECSVALADGGSNGDPVQEAIIQTVDLHTKEQNVQPDNWTTDGESVQEDEPGQTRG